MKALLISFAVGLIVGVVYGVIRVKSPAPPIVALLGLLGMVLGEQAGGWLSTKKAQAATVAQTHIVGESKDQQQRLSAQLLHHKSAPVSVPATGSSQIRPGATGPVRCVG